MGFRYDADPELSRRSLIATTVAAAGFFAVKNAFSHQVDLNPDALSNNDHNGIETDFTADFAASSPFEYATTQEVANDLNITAGDYWKLSPETVAHVSESGLFRTEETMAPIFFPEIEAYRQVFESAANEHGVPVNFLATLGCMESAGIEDAHSGADAYGLVQVVPYYHFDKFAKYLPENASYDDYVLAKAGDSNKPSQVPLDIYLEAFTKPEYNISAGAEYLRECIDDARRYFPGLDGNSMVVFALAAAAYNGGAGNMAKGFNGMPLESKLYVNHASRILLDVEIALSLRKRGLGNNEILLAMKSKHMDAMAYTYGVQTRSASDFAPYETQAIHISTISDIRKAGREYAEPYFLYYDGKTTNYQTPMAPGLRIWFDGGGKGQFIKSEKNVAWRA